MWAASGLCGGCLVIECLAMGLTGTAGACGAGTTALKFVIGDETPGSPALDTTTTAFVQLAARADAQVLGGMKVRWYLADCSQAGLNLVQPAGIWMRATGSNPFYQQYVFSSHLLRLAAVTQNGTPMTRSNDNAWQCNGASCVLTSDVAVTFTLAAHTGQVLTFSRTNPWAIDASLGIQFAL